jgi:putative membrane protein
MNPKFINRFLVLLYGAGLIGLSFPDFRPYFQPLTPYTLWFTGFICLYFYPTKNIKTYAGFALLFLAGFLIELAGVKSGKIFGEYAYGQTLGFKIAGIPLVIGMNWIILLMSTNAIVEEWNIGGIFGKAAIGAGLMTFLDLFIEPVAMSFDFWQWKLNQVPAQNFAAWWLVSFVFHYIYQEMGLNLKSSLYRLVALLQFVFFIALLVLAT